MESLPGAYPPHPNAIGKWKQGSLQDWMKQKQEQQPLQARSDIATRLPSPRPTRIGEVNVEAQQQSGKRPRTVPGTNVHSAYAGISVHNALLSLRPPPPDAKIGSKHLPWLRLTEWETMRLRKRMKKSAVWTPSGEMIKKELAEIGRGPYDYAKAKKDAMNHGVEFLDEDVVEGSTRKALLSDQPFLGPNRGMELNQAKKRKREAHAHPTEDRHLEGSTPVHQTKEQQLWGLNAKGNGRMAVSGSESDRTYRGVHRMSAGIPNIEGVETAPELTIVKPCMPSNEPNEPIVGYGKVREMNEVELDDVKKAAGSRSTANSFQAGKANMVDSDSFPAAPFGLGPDKSDPIRESTLVANPRTTLTAHAVTAVPIDLTEMSSTDSDASSATSSTESHEMSAPPTSLDQFPSSESSAESSIGAGSLPPLKRHSSKQPPVFYGPGHDDSSRMATSPGITPSGDQSLVATSSTTTDNLYPGIVSTRTPTSREKGKDYAYIAGPKDDTRAILVSPATSNTLTHGPVFSRTLLDRQAREIVNAAVTRAIELRDPVDFRVARKLDEKTLSNSTSVRVPLPGQLDGNARVSHVAETAALRPHRSSGDVALSRSMPAGEEAVYATTSTTTRPGRAAVATSPKPETIKCWESEAIVMTQNLRHGSVPSCTDQAHPSYTSQGHDQLGIKQGIALAVAKSLELRDPIYGQAVLKLAEQSLRNPAIADLLVAVLMRKPTPAQSAEFSSRIRAARNRHREHQPSRNTSEPNFSMPPSSGCSSVSGGPSLHPRTSPLACSNSSTLSTSSSPSISTATSMPPLSVTSTTGSYESLSTIPNFPPDNSHNSNVSSTLIIPSTAPSTATSDPINIVSPFVEKSSDPPKPTILPSSSNPGVRIGVPGGSGVMAFNRARRRARILAVESGNLVVTQQAANPNGAGINPSPNTNDRHQRLRDFVVNGRVT